MHAWVRLIAGRYTLSGSMTLMSIVSAAGLVVGVAVLILVLSIVNGFERELQDRVLSVLPHGVVQAQSPIVEYEKLIKKVRKHPEVLEAAPYINGSALMVANHKMTGISFSGVLPEFEPNVSDIGSYLLRGELKHLQSKSWGVLLGISLAKELNVDLGDKVSLVLPQFQYTLAGPIPRLKQFKVVGVFQSGADIDKNQAFIHFQDAQVLTRINGAMGLRLKMKDMFNAPEIIYELRQAIKSPRLSGKSWFATHGNLYNAIRTQKSTMFLLLSLLIAVAAFNVVSNLMMTVNEKEADIAILKTMGATPNGILMVFICHGALLGLVGVLAGVVLGVSMALSASRIFVWFERHFSPGIMDQYFIHYLPSEIQMFDIGLVTVTSFIICLTASIYPARKAARALPVETLQYAA